MSNNMNRLGEVLADKMKRTSAAAIPTTMELGVINSNLSLTTDGLKRPIPKGEYMVDITLVSDSYMTSSESHSHSDGSHSHTGDDHSHSGGSHSHDGGAHSHKLPTGFRSLKSGDRVLVAWCGGEPVVVAIVTSS